MRIGRGTTSTITTIVDIAVGSVLQNLNTGNDLYLLLRMIKCLGNLVFGFLENGGCLVSR